MGVGEGWRGGRVPMRKAGGAAETLWGVGFWGWGGRGQDNQIGGGSRRSHGWVFFLGGGGRRDAL